MTIQVELHSLQAYGYVVLQDGTDIELSGSQADINYLMQHLSQENLITIIGDGEELCDVYLTLSTGYFPNGKDNYTYLPEDVNDLNHFLINSVNF
ncbi:hypothetical protein GR11A_00244 [Vibrio phage vB_VcorM_GR11A]|nr:hypothetical protein GR11A_00244 [Vibrio phage vB_VcorM_GR11A]